MQYISICKQSKNPMNSYVGKRASWSKSFLNHHKLSNSCQSMIWQEIGQNRPINWENRALRPLFLHQHLNNSLRFKWRIKYWSLHPRAIRMNCIFRYSNGTRTIREDMAMSHPRDQVVAEIIKLQTIFIHFHAISLIKKITSNNKSTTLTLDYFHLWQALIYLFLRLFWKRISWQNIILSVILQTKIKNVHHWKQLRVSSTFIILKIYRITWGFSWIREESPRNNKLTEIIFNIILVPMNRWLQKVTMYPCFQKHLNIL